MKELKDLDLSYTLFLVIPYRRLLHAYRRLLLLHQKLFSWLLRGLDKSDRRRMGWYALSMVRVGKDFKVDFKVDFKKKSMENSILFFILFLRPSLKWRSFDFMSICKSMSRIKITFYF